MEPQNTDNHGSNGRFLPGNTYGGSRGPNKVSKIVKEAITQFLEDNVGEIQESFDKLKPKEKLQFIADILPYAAPKMQSITSENETRMEITLRFKDAE